MILQKLLHSKWTAAGCVLFLVYALTACGGGSGNSPDRADPPATGYRYAPPRATGDGWTIGDVHDLDVIVDLLEQMMNRMNSDFYVVDSIAIAYQGELILDETLRTTTNEFDAWVGNNNPSMHVLFSASKSIASLAMGIAIDQSLIPGVDVPYLSLFPYASYDNWDARKQDMSLEDVLTMRLGLQWNEWDPPYSSPDNAMFRFYDRETDYSKALLDLPVATDPGTTFAYNTPASVSLGQAIENSGPLTLIDFGSQNLLGPLSVTDVEVFETPTGLPDLGRGLYFLTRDFLKFGQLVLDGGRWNGDQVVSEEWIATSTQARLEIGWSEPEKFAWKIDGYAYQWWTGYFEIDGQRLQTINAWGSGEQHLMIIPELELVVAIFCHAWEPTDDETNQPLELIRRFVIPAIPQA